MNKRQELVKLIQEHPDLELKFMVSCNEYEDGFYTEVTERECRITIDELGYYSDDFVGEYDEIFERVQNDLADNPEYAKLSDEEYDKICENFIKENIEFKEYIVVWL